jgi:putative transposase
LTQNSTLSKSAQCRILGLHRSGLNYENCGESALNLELMRLMDMRYHYHPYEGAPRMHNYLTLNEGYQVSVNRVARLYYKVMGLRAIIPRPHTSKRNKEHAVYPHLLRGLAVTHPNQVWATDITYMPLPNGFMYLTAVIDLYSRFVLNWSVSNTMEAEWCQQMMEGAMEKYGVPGIVNTDQGAQYTSDIFSEFILDSGSKLSMDGVGRATDNAFIERLWRTVKYENVRFSEYTDGLKLRKGMDKYFPKYNQRRHSSLEKKLPKDVYENGLISIPNNTQN